MRTRLLSLLTFAPLVTAQQIWNVPPGSPIDPYIAQASPGDLVVLTAGSSYVDFTVNKGVTIFANGASIFGLTGSGAVTFQIPAGQRASLVGAQLTAVATTSIRVVSGIVSLSDIHFGVPGTIDIGAGSTAVQLDHVTSSVGSELRLAGGFCEVVDSRLQGRNASWTYNGYAWHGWSAIEQTGGVLVASNTVVDGGNAGTFFAPPYFTYPSAAGFVQTGGLAFLTDCTITGGDGFPANVGAGIPGEPGQVAIAANGNVSIARTTLTEGASSTAVSSGYVTDPELVGMRTVGTLSLGAAFQAIATGGGSGGWIGIVASLSSTLGYVAPIVEPVLTGPVYSVTLALAAPGGTVGYSLAVPNTTSLRGLAVWLQGIQLTGLQFRASAIAGGTVR